MNICFHPLRDYMSHVQRDLGSLHIWRLLIILERKGGGGERWGALGHAGRFKNHNASVNRLDKSLVPCCRSLVSLSLRFAVSLSRETNPRACFKPNTSSPFPDLCYFTALFPFMSYCSHKSGLFIRNPITRLYICLKVNSPSH